MDIRQEKKITLLFFQNCVSPHQIPYIRECVNDSRVDAVYLIVPRVDYSERKDMGWENDNLVASTKINYLLMPSDKELVGIIEEIESPYCIFSGIRADRDVFRWLNLSLQFSRAKRFIVTEPPYTFKKPLWMHYVRFILQDYKYIKYIDGVFGIGEDAVKYYKSLSKKWQVFPFHYVTEPVERTAPVPDDKSLQLLYVGSLSDRKNVILVINALEGCQGVKFTIIGDGEQRESLEVAALRKGLDVEFCGKKQMSEIPLLMQQHDVLVLPSLHDGWGAVVNEAMTLGLYVIVSDRCGVKALIRSEEDGLIFKSNNSENLRACINKSIKNLELLRENVVTCIEKSKAIQGKSVAEYFVDSLLVAKN